MVAQPMNLQRLFDIKWGLPIEFKVLIFKKDDLINFVNFVELESYTRLIPWSHFSVLGS